MTGSFNLISDMLYIEIERDDLCSLTILVTPLVLLVFNVTGPPLKATALKFKGKFNVIVYDSNIFDMEK